MTEPSYFPGKVNVNSTILIVDDLPMFIAIEGEFLKYTGAEVLTARNGLEALEVIKSRRPDIVFMDLEMPMMDGATCCRRIRSDAAIANVPVIMVTAKGYEEQCLSAGCNEFLTKPLDRDVFLSAARRFLPNIDRREKRVPVDIACDIRLHGETRSGRVHNVSMNGAFLATNYFGVPGNVIQISFTLPGGGHKIDCPGRIAWINMIDTGSHPKGFGVKFAMMNNEAKATLGRFIEANR